MNNKGFTLVEILAVLMITIIITSISFAGIGVLNKNIHQNMYEETVALIEASATRYGEDHQNKLNTSCTVDGSAQNKCGSITVQTLIDTGYISTKKKNDAGEAVLIDERKKEEDENYYLNSKTVYIYLENDIVYSKYVE